MIDFIYNNKEVVLPETLCDDVSIIVSKIEASSFRFIKFSATKTFPERDNYAYLKKIKILAIGEKKHRTDLLSKFTRNELEKIRFVLKYCPQIGQKFPKIKALSYPDGIEKTIKFAKKDNKFYVVDYWREMTGIKEKIKAYIKYFNNHPENECKIQLICFVSERFLSNEQSKIIYDFMRPNISFYVINESKLSEKQFLEIYPDDCFEARIVHFGKIVSLEPEMSVEALRVFFNRLTKEKSTKKKWCNIPSDQCQRLFANISDKLDEIYALSQYSHKILSSFKYKITSKKPIKFNHKFRLFLSLANFKKYLPTVDSFQNYFYQIMPKNSISLKINCLAEEFCERGIKCDLCHRDFDDEDNQYLCIECNPKHYHCESCHQKKNDGEGLKQFAHPHCLYLITSESKNLDELVIGKGRFSSKHFNEKNFCRHHGGIGCDNRYNPLKECEGTVKGTRYKCAHCRDYDFCEICMKKWLEGGSDAMIKTAKERGHEKWHIFMLIESSFY